MTKVSGDKHNFSSYDRTYASLRIYHKSEDPNNVTKILHITPDWTVKVGEKTVLNRHAEHSSWCITTKDSLNNSRDLSFHVEWLLKKISTKKVQIKKLISAGYSISIFVLIGSCSSNVECLFGEKLIKRLSEFPINIFFDIWLNDEK